MSQKAVKANMFSALGGSSRKKKEKKKNENTAPPPAPVEIKPISVDKSWGDITEEDDELFLGPTTSSPTPNDGDDTDEDEYSSSSSEEEEEEEEVQVEKEQTKKVEQKKKPRTPKLSKQEKKKKELEELDALLNMVSNENAADKGGDAANSKKDASEKKDEKTTETDAAAEFLSKEMGLSVETVSETSTTKKKKKKKANPSAEEAALEQLQKCVKSCMNTLALLAESYKEDLRERIDKIDEDGSQDLKWQGELPIQLRQARKVSKSLVSSERDIAGRLLQISTGIKTLVKVKY
mmetsp:Transcript_8200/g.15187  ORF Transcript_8200/g.15187 Transcript_8200/m.15187 type:complete len:293 (-) Transcript_8200:27-905(-)